jgi:hypothetical protein
VRATTGGAWLQRQAAPSRHLAGKSGTIRGWYATGGMLWEGVAFSIRQDTTIPYHATIHPCKGSLSDMSGTATTTSSSNGSGSFALHLATRPRPSHLPALNGCFVSHSTAQHAVVKEKYACSGSLYAYVMPDVMPQKLSTVVSCQC